MSRHLVNCARVAAVLLALARTATAEEGPAAPSAPVLARTLLLLKDRYVDPARLAPRRMLLAALVRVSETVDDLVVEGDEAGEALTLRMGAEAHRIELASVTTVWELGPALATALGFVAPRAGVVDARTLEREAVNGLLSTLDPRSVLLDPAGAAELHRQLRTPQGSLGMIVGHRGGRLTVTEVLPGAPAARLGLAPGDVVAELDGHSTAGRELRQVVDWLLGPVGSEVTLVRVRRGRAPERLTARRERVTLPGLASSRLFAERVAYVRLSAFTAGAPRELRRALQDLRGGGEPLRGVVLDLRGNPGGLLDAAAEVADLFLSEGRILALAAASGPAMPTHSATAADDDVTAPVVVLVDRSSTGASEIVAAALRDHDRALLVGQQTPGLGSVQNVYEAGEADAPAEAPLLELTVAYHRTPGDRPFDGVGLTPDVLVRAGRVTREAVHFFAPPPAPSAAAPGTPAPGSEVLGTFTALADGPTPVAWDPADPREEALPEAADPARDPAATFAAELLASAETPDRAGLRAAAGRLLPAWQAAQQERLTGRLAALGVDWTRAPSEAPPRVAVSFAPLPRRIVAGEPVPWTVTVENLGPGPISRLRGWTIAPGIPHLDGLELIFGTLRPGAKRSATVQVASGALTAGAAPLTLHLEDGDGRSPADVPARFEVASIARPALAARLRLACAARRCVPPERSNPLKLEATVRALGPTPAADVALTLASGDARVDLSAGRAQLGRIAPGASRRAAVDLRLRAEGEDPIPLQVELQAGPERTRCALALAPGGPLPFTRECRPLRLGLTPDPDAGPLAAEGDALRLSGDASAPAGERLRGVAIHVNGRKVLFRRAADGGPVAFAADLPLRPGANAVVVTATAADGAALRRAFQVLRR